MKKLKKLILLVVIISVFTITANAETLNCKYTYRQVSTGENVRVLQKILNEKVGCGVVEDIWTANHDLFLMSMADAAKSIVDYFDGKIVYINVMKNMSVDCDCCAVAEDPKIADIGILASTDPVAIDKACIDLVYGSNDPGKKHLIERIESRNGILTTNASYELGIGSLNYELIKID